MLVIQEKVIDTNWRNNSVFKKWWLEGYYPETPLLPGSAAGRFRYNGRLLFWQNFESLKSGIQKLIAQALEIAPDTRQAGQEHTIYLVSSIAGGTGAGMLIDVGFLVRDILENYPQFKLFALLYHGSIWERCKIADSNDVALGTLTQLEKWMAQPENYELKHGRKKLPGNTNKFSRFFDMVYLIDQKDMGGNHFINRGGQLWDQYVDLGSWLLYLLSLDEVKGSYQNVIADFQGLDEEDKNSTQNGRSRRYGSASLSVITVPYQEIADWLKSSFITNFRKGVDSSKLQDPLILLQDIGIHDSADNQLSNHLMSCDSFSGLLEYLNNISSDMYSTDSIDIFSSNVQNYELRDKTTIKEKFELWEEDLKKILHKNSNNFIEKLKKLLVEDLEETLDFEGTTYYLEQLINALRQQNSEIKKKYSRSRSEDEISNELNEIINEIEEIPTGGIRDLFNKGKIKEGAEQWVELSGFKSQFADIKDQTYTDIKISKILLSSLTFFYEILIKSAEAEKQTLDNASQIYKKLIEKYESIKISYNYDRSEIIDPDRLKRQEFPLILSVPVDRIDLQEVSENFVNHKDYKNQFSRTLWKGIETDKRRHSGIASYIEKISGDFKDTGGLRLDLIISEGYESLDEIVKFEFDNLLKKEVNSRFSMDKALRNYFGKKYLEYIRTREDKERLAAFIQKLKAEVGDETIASLQNQKLDKDKWVEIALEGFFRNVAQSIYPFWSVRNREEFETKYHRPRLNKYSPKETPVIYRYGKFPKNLPLDWFQDIGDLQYDPYRIFLFTYSHGCPLYLLDAVRGAGDLFEDSSRLKCAINDVRFMDEWKDNIEHYSRFEFNDFLFIFAIAFGIIERKKRGKAKSKTFYYGSKNLGTITDAMYKIGRDYTTEIKEEIKRKLWVVLDPNKPDQEVITVFNSLLAKVDEELNPVEPPSTKGTQTAHNIWSHLKEQVVVVRDRQGNVMKYEGRFYCTEREEVASLVREHTGITL